MSNDEREDMVDSELGRYLSRHPDEQHAYFSDGLAAYHRKWLRRVLVTFDMAAEDEGLDEQARRRVVRSVLWGSSDVDAAEARLREQRRMYDELSRRTAPAMFVQDRLAWMSAPDGDR